MRQLTPLTRKHSVGGVARDERGLPEADVADVQDDGVLRHLLEDAALVEQRPHKTIVLVVLLVLALVPVVLVPVHGNVVRLVVLINYVFG